MVFLEIPVATEGVGLEISARSIVGRIQHFSPGDDLIPDTQRGQVEHDQVKVVCAQSASQIGSQGIFQFPQTLFRQAIPYQNRDVHVAEGIGMTFGVRTIEIHGDYL